MRVRRMLAWVVFSMGLTTLIATSDDDSDDDGWSQTASASASLHSEGAGDDKIIRIAISRSDALAYRSLSAYVSITATANRAASDVRIDWLYPGRQDGGVGLFTDSMLRFSQGFMVLDTQHSLSLVPCAWEMECVAVQEARVHADASDSYELTLQLRVRVEDGSSDPPPGALTLAVEVLDAP